VISNILFKKPVPVGALFLSDDHLESVHHILADLVYVESETKPEGNNMATPNHYDGHEAAERFKENNSVRCELCGRIFIKSIPYDVTVCSGCTVKNLYPIGYARLRKEQQDRENILRSKAIDKLKEGSNIMPVGKDIPMKEAYSAHYAPRHALLGSDELERDKEPKRAPKNELIESALQSVNDRLNVLHGEVIGLIESIKGGPMEPRSSKEEPLPLRPMNVLLDELPKDFAVICERINSDIENVQSIRALIL